MRCFIAVPVPPALAVTLGQQAVPDQGRRSAATDLHLTLAFLGERDPDWARRLWPALAGLAAATPAFNLTLTEIGPFPHREGRIWAARAEPAPPLMGLHRNLWRCLEESGVAGEERAFLPHVTLARLPGPTRAAPVPGPWHLPVTELVFQESPPDGGGYRTLKRWPLQ
tara:strand:+ start:8982 stop:9485 length:504 start_codon:yes stop_codon:yes gene_type:complete